MDVRFSTSGPRPGPPSPMGEERGGLRNPGGGRHGEATGVGGGLVARWERGGKISM
jgi:hypothetical protein